MGWLGEAGVRQAIKPVFAGKEFDHFFPRPFGKHVEIKRSGEVKHTIAFIPQMVQQTLADTVGIAKHLLDKTSLYESCKRLWHFVYDHIRYQRDDTGIEQVRRPARLWWDRKGDCDCMTSFIDSVLVNWYLAGMKLEIENIVAAYPDEADRYKHIYPVCITSEGRHIVIDCVTHQFDYEEPYLYKARFPMKLHYLNGIDPQGDDQSYMYNDVGKLNIKLPDKLKKVVSNSGKIIKRGVHAVNRVNPTTLLLRSGILASMKLNLMNVAGRLKWAYIDEASAKKRGFNMERYQHLKKVRDKAERIFYSAGGKPENLREAILKGKGNKGKEVAGIGVIPIYAMPGEKPISEVIGSSLFHKEIVVDGLGAEPITMTAALASAAAVIAALAAELKKVGVLGKGDNPSESPDQSGEEIAPTELPPDDSAQRSAESDPEQSADSQQDSEKKSSESNPGADGKPPEKSKGLMGWIKEHPVASGLIGVGIVTGVVLGVKAINQNKETPQAKPMAGFSKSKRGRKKKQKNAGFSSLKYVPLK